MVEILRLLRKDRKSKNNSLPPNLAQIRDIALKAPKIWRDPKGNKSERYKAEVNKLFQLVSLELTEDPHFYQKLSSDAHIRALRVLGDLVPKQPEGYEVFRTDPSSAHRVIVGYMEGFVKYSKSFQSGGINDANFDSDEKVAMHLRRELFSIPRYYLNKVFEQIGFAQNNDT